MTKIKENYGELLELNRIFLSNPETDPSKFYVMAQTPHGLEYQGHYNSKLAKYLLGYEFKAEINDNGYNCFTKRFPQGNITITLT